MTRPRALLLGDSICVSEAYSFGSSGYARAVAAALEPHGIAVDWSRTGTGSTRVFLEQLRAGQIPGDVDLVHFNAGLHDIVVRDPAQGCAVPIEEYAANLREIVAAFRARGEVDLVWAATTPVVDEWHQREKSFIRRNGDVLDYNRAAAAVMGELDVPVHDLYSVLAQADPGDVLGPDGCHPSTVGRELLATAVGDFVRKRIGR